MRKLLLGLLVGAAALAPALARAQVEERTREDLAADGAVRVRTPDTPRPERAERREARGERRADRLEGRAGMDTGGTGDRPRRDRDGDGLPDGPRQRRLDGDGMRTARPDRMAERPDAQVFPPRRERDRAEWRDRREARQDRREEWRDDRREARRDLGRSRPDRRDGWWDDSADERSRSDWGRGTYGGGLVWNRGWRDDRRYDWNRHRQYDRGAYRLPRYYAPDGFGYEYRRFGLGASLSRPLYAESYWIEDPYSYRLPPAYGPYRWVRYWGDALLVDLRTGRVVDTVYGIFD